MQRIAKFEKVSFNQFFGTLNLPIEEATAIYGDIKLPVRATKGSAGYDFFSPIDVTLLPGQSALIPTGIRVKIEDGWVLKIYPRSGLGFKFKMQLNNTVGIIDADYYNSDNEGHIMCKIFNDSRENKTIEIKKGNGFCQGIFVQFGITFDDEVSAVRNGGFGSTTK